MFIHVRNVFPWNYGAIVLSKDADYPTFRRSAYWVEATRLLTDQKCMTGRVRVGISERDDLNEKLVIASYKAHFSIKWAASRKFGVSDSFSWQ